MKFAVRVLLLAGFIGASKAAAVFIPAQDADQKIFSDLASAFDKARGSAKQMEKEVEARFDIDSFMKKALGTKSSDVSPEEFASAKKPYVAQLVSTYFDSIKSCEGLTMTAKEVEESGGLKKIKGFFKCNGNQGDNTKIIVFFKGGKIQDIEIQDAIRFGAQEANRFEQLSTAKAAIQEMKKPSTSSTESQ